MMSSTTVRHPVTLAGAVIATVGAVAFLTLLAADLLGLFTNPYAGLVIFIAGTVLHGVVYMGLYHLLDLRDFPSPWKPLAAQALGNALVGIVAFGIVESLPGLVERRRARRVRR